VGSEARNVFVLSKLGFESHPSHACLRLFCVSVVLCAGSGLATGLITRPRSSTDCLEDSKFRINSERTQTRKPNP
jgi:hypothetical protein